MKGAEAAEHKAARGMTNRGSMTEPEQGEKRDYFISYNRADGEWAQWIGWVLEEAGYSVFLQAWDFRPGGNFVLDMQRAATNAVRTIALLSPDFLSAGFPQAEWAARFREDPTGVKGLLVPVHVRECTPQGLLGSITYIDLAGSEEFDAQNTLLQGLERRRAKPPTRPGFPGPRARTIPEHPRYPGPVNVRLENPTVPVENWTEEANSWLSINEAIGGAGFKPLTIKAAYVVGIIHDMCGAVAHFLRIPPNSLPVLSPAYDTLCSAIELLGYCIAGTGALESSDYLGRGLRWLGFSTTDISDQEPLVVTAGAEYTIPALLALRRSALQAHGIDGQTGVARVEAGLLDHELLNVLRAKLAAGVNRWWNELQSSESLCNALAQSDVVSFHARYVVRKTWVLFERDVSGTYHSITEILNRFQ